MRALFWTLPALMVLACDGGTGQPPPSMPIVPGAPRVAPVPGEWKSEIRLDGLLPAGAELVGVAVDPAGARYVLDRTSGLWVVSASAAKLVVSTTEIAAIAGLGLDLELTDVASFGPDRFIFTAVGEGFVLDLSTNSIEQRFCYLPAPQPMPVDAPSVSQTLRMAGIDAKERTESVARSPESGLLFAQPRTIRMDTGAVAGAELFVFRLPAEQPIQVRRIADVNFMASGMVTSVSNLIMASHDKLYEMTAWSDPFLLRDFAAPLEITGMAREKNGDLLLLDAAGRRLLEVSER